MLECNYNKGAKNARWRNLGAFVGFFKKTEKNTPVLHNIPYLCIPKKCIGLQQQ